MSFLAAGLSAFVRRCQCRSSSAPARCRGPGACGRSTLTPPRCGRDGSYRGRPESGQARPQVGGRPGCGSRCLRWLGSSLVVTPLGGSGNVRAPRASRFPNARGPTLGGETVTQAREAQVDLAAGERLPRRVPRQRIDDDLGGGAPSSSWPIRFSQTPAVARRWPATGWRRSTGWYRPWLPRDTAGLGPPGRAALPSTSQDHINRSLHGFRGLPG